MARHISARVWRAIGTIAHNRSFTPRDLSEYAGVDGKLWIDRLYKEDLLTRTGRGHYYPTSKGWARIEGVYGDASRRKKTRGYLARRQLARPTRVGSRFRDPTTGRFA